MLHGYEHVGVLFAFMHKFTHGDVDACLCAYREVITNTHSDVSHTTLITAENKLKTIYNAPQMC